MSGGVTGIEMFQAPGGGYFLGGSDYGSTVLTKVDDTGAVSWSRLTPGVDGDVAISVAGEVAIGYIRRQPAFHDVLTVKRFDPKGNTVWVQTLVLAHLAGQDSRVAMDSAGNVYVSQEFSGAGELRKFDAATGAQVFAITFPVTIYSPVPTCDSTGSVYVAEATYINIQPAVSLSKYSASGTLLWSKIFPGNSPEGLLDTTGNPYLVFSASSTTRVIKYDPSGNVLWDSTTAQPAGSNFAAVSRSGEVAVSGRNGLAAQVTLFNSAGVVQWTRADGAKGGPVLVDASGDVYAYSTDPNAPSITKFDTTGNVLWTQTSGLDPHSGWPYGDRLMLDSLGRVVMFFTDYSVISGNTFALSLFSSAGTPVWSEDVGNHNSYDATANSVTDASGNTYLATDGYTAGGKVGIAKFNSSGGVSWSRIVPPVVNAEADEVGPCLSPTGGVALALTTSTQIQSPAPALGVVSYDTSGNLLWTYVYNGQLMMVKDIKVYADGSVYLCVVRYDAITGGPYLRVIKLTPTGTLAWMVDRSEISGAEFSRARLALDSTGAVYLSFSIQTETASSTMYSGAIAKYDASGNLKWTHIFDSQSAADSGDGIGVDSQGHVFWAVHHYDPVASAEEELLREFDSDGNTLGTTQLSNFLGPSLAIDASDNIFIGGDAGEFTDTVVPAVQKLNTAGTSFWTTYITDSNQADGMKMTPDNVGGVILGVTTKTATAYSPKIYRLAPDGSRALPASGGAFVNGAIVDDLTPNDEYLKQVGVDSQGNIYISGSTYSASGSYDLNVVKYQASNSSFVDQSLASSMSAGETYQATVIFQNTGFNTWTKGAGYKLAISNVSTWGVSNVSLNTTDAIAPGQSKSFKFYVYAPTIRGTYNFQCKMYKNLSSFGSLSTVLPIVVTVHPYAARYVTETTPSTVTAGSTFSISVDMRNVGTNTWTLASGYGLSPVAGNQAWGVTSIPLSAADSIVQGADKVFTFNCVAPATAGSYTMRWQMHAGATFFGDRTISKTITVTPWQPFGHGA